MRSSIIIPVYNQTEQLLITLQALNKQSNKSFEVIVVDDGSDETVENFVDLSAFYFDISILRQNNKGRSAARNMGIKQAKFELIIFCDADRVPGKDFVKSHIDEHTEENLVVIGEVREVYVSNLEYAGDMFFKDPDFFIKKSKIPKYPKIVGNIFDAGVTESKMPWISTFSGNMSIRKEMLSSIGYFSELFTNWGFEHFELGYRAFKSNLKFVKTSQAVNYHIAHSRDLSRLKEYFIQSIHIMEQLHPKDEIIRFFGDFMLGKVSLQEIEPSPEASWKEKIETPIFFQVDK